MSFDFPAIYMLAVGAAAAFASAVTVYAVARRKGAGRFLCDDCRFNSTEACLKPERPYATRCTAYRAAAEKQG